MQFFRRFKLIMEFNREELMKQKYFPGPWHISDNDGAHVMIRGQVGVGFNGQTLAKVWLQDSDFNDATARLIATAPELLEAAIALESAMTERPIVHLATKTLNRLNDLRAAISKATEEK